MRTQAPLYSGILFGPPGTAKTSIVTAIAYYLGWSFVTIDTADFLGTLI
jgi:MoxR-like ATPase